MHKSDDLEKYFVERANAGDIEGLVAFYEPNTVLVDSSSEIAKGLNQIREFFIKFLASRPQFEPSNQAAAVCCGDIALTSSYLSNDDVTAETARRQLDGNWLWVVDRFSLGANRQNYIAKGLCVDGRQLIAFQLQGECGYLHPHCKKFKNFSFRHK